METLLFLSKPFFMVTEYFGNIEHEKRDKLIYLEFTGSLLITWVVWCLHYGIGFLLSQMIPGRYRDCPPPTYFMELYNGDPRYTWHYYVPCILFLVLFGLICYLHIDADLRPYTFVFTFFFILIHLTCLFKTNLEFFLEYRHANEKEISFGRAKTNAGISDEYFDNYLRHTEPMSGIKQDQSLALKNLGKAVELNHPEATFVLGSLKFTGDGVLPRDTAEGIRLMRKGRSLGAAMVDVITEQMGIDLDDEKISDGSFEPTPNSATIQVQCQHRIETLCIEKIITKQQKTDLLEVVRSHDKIHLINILGILNNSKELKRLANYAGRIKGWDQEKSVFYIS